MNPYIYLSIVIAYFFVLLILSQIVNTKRQNHTFYNGDKKSPWFIVAFGMIGTTISGVTFISVPGEVGTSSFHYFQFVMGNIVGYIIIATLLIPFYYKKKVISIYSILEEKIGTEGHLATSGLFIISKIIGASFRLFLASLVIHIAISEPLGIPFSISVLFCLLLIWLYTFRTGIKTIIWSDTIQTVVLIVAAISTIILIIQQTEIPPLSIFTKIKESGSIRIFDFNWLSTNNFFKQFISGIFITIALNGFDQDIIQKNLTCRNSQLARKNMLWFSAFFGITVFVFLILGALLYYYAEIKGIELPTKTDQLYPMLALNHLSSFVAIMFILGISAAAFSSADSAITSLTVAFCVDFLKLPEKERKNNNSIRTLIHLVFSIIIFFVIMLFYKMNNESVVVAIFKAAGYTYGPILGVFLFSFFIKRKPHKYFIIPSLIASPFLTYFISRIVYTSFNNYKFGFELIIINAVITILLLFIFSSPTPKLKLLNHENTKFP
ncbi:MAG: sodium:solute symporter [Prolixibacteraceae bacterium]|nr:sodium:solute symporter [Prolixibacteraceae bacterium]